MHSILLANSTTLDDFLTMHVIVDTDETNNRLFYKSHDENIFQNRQTFRTLNKGVNLITRISEMNQGKILMNENLVF